MKYTLLFCFSVIYFSSCRNISEDKLADESNKSMDYSIEGEIAYDVTKYVSQYWRVPGNAGFDSSIYKVVSYLKQAGYENNPNARLNYRIEKRTMKNPTWEPISASFKIGDEELLNFQTNRHMIALNSFSTDVKATIVWVQAEEIGDIKKKDVKGKIVYTEASPYAVFKAALDAGALGVITYNNPAYLQPEKNQTSIQFRSIRYDDTVKPWLIPLSYKANERLKQLLKEGKKTAKINIETKFYESPELTLVAEIKGSEKPNERFVFSAHVQEPGANDNASGVGATTEMAYTIGKQVKGGEVDLRRTLTFLWGDEISSTRRFVTEDSVMAKDIKWGVSLDMVGENTAVTGGSFLIEKMPDPSAIWTRGNDKHTEWGGSQLAMDDLKPHYLNDFIINRFQKYGKENNWEVNYNPYEGGSDHVPFLRADIPSVLLWHFTDQFYHTDNDRIDKVSKETLRHVSINALNTAVELVNSDKNTAKSIILELKNAAINRMAEEQRVSVLALKEGDEIEEQVEIIAAWKNWYNQAIETTTDMVKNTNALSKEIEAAKKEVTGKYDQIISELKGSS